MLKLYSAQMKRKVIDYLESRGVDVSLIPNDHIDTLVDIISFRIYLKSLIDCEVEWNRIADGGEIEIMDLHKSIDEARGV